MINIYKHLRNKSDQEPLGPESHQWLSESPSPPSNNKLFCSKEDNSSSSEISLNQNDQISQSPNFKISNFPKMKSDRRSEFVTLTDENEHICHCQKNQGLSIAKQKFWYTISSVLVLCLLLLSTALVLKSGNECQHHQGPEARSMTVQTIPVEPVACIPQEVVEECPRGRKGKKCREKQRSTSSTDKIVEKLAPKLVGKYKQTEMINMEAYLEAEGGSYFFRKMALKVYPNLEIKEYPDKG